MEHLETLSTGLLGETCQRLARLFGCPVIIARGEERMHSMKRFLNGKPVTWPFGFLVPTGFSDTDKVQGARYLSTSGVPITVGESGLQRMVRLLPTAYHAEFEYHTDSLAAAFHVVRKWRMARRLGYLKFNFIYGSRFSFIPHFELSADIDIPELEDVSKETGKYVFKMTMTIHGYESDPVPLTVGTIDTVALGMTLETALGGNPRDVKVLNFPKG